jgi:regulator of replication initiation timing
MSEKEAMSERLDRIEATVEATSGQIRELATRLDNQVVVNAELRAAAEAQLQINHQYQENFLVIVTEMRNTRQEILGLQTQVLDIQSQVLGLQTENGRILDILQGRGNGD